MEWAKLQDKQVVLKCSGHVWERSNDVARRMGDYIFPLHDAIQTIFGIHTLISLGPLFPQTKYGIKVKAIGCWSYF